MKRHAPLLLLLLLIVVLLLGNLFIGSVRIPASQTLHVLLGGTAAKESWTFIVLHSRIPAAIAPDLGERRSYKVWGRASLSPDDEWLPVNANALGSTSARFFKVSIGQNP